ncbi:MAG: helix-hairpin-helix domain-containing protein, partial [Bacteroidota bacterium]
FGQGLLLSGGFSTGKSSFVTNIKRAGRKVRPYTSVNEAIFLRGGAAHLQFGDHFNFVAFGSYRSRDANITQLDTLENFEVPAFTSLQLSGLHRTPNEIEDEGAINQLTTGASLEWRSRQSHLAANFVYTEFDADFNRNTQPYNQFQFSSGSLVGGSLDYSFLWRNINFFGETAVSDNGGFATTNGALIGLDRRIDLAILYRNFSRDYQSLFGDPFAETIGGSNEAGLYLGLDIKPSYNWQFSAYFDTWSHPWLRFGVDAPSQGYEYLAQARYRIKRKLEVYVRLRDEYRQRNRPANETNIDFLIWERRTQLRANFSYIISKGLEVRNRIELILFKEDDLPLSRGFLAYQDLIVKPVGSPLSFTGRFAIFDTDDFDSRIYAYENDI